MISASAPVTPAAPAFTNPTENAHFDAAFVAANGTAAPGSFVHVSDNGIEVGSAPATDEGTWTATLTLAGGAHSLTARATDPAGNVGAFGAPVRFETTIAPDARTPAIVTPAADSVQQGSVTITGTSAAPAGTHVTVREGSVVLTTTSVQPDGGWSARVTLDTGVHQVKAGIGGSTSAARRFEVDAAPPAATIATAPNALFVLEPATIDGRAIDNAGVASIELRFYGAAGGLVLTQAAECACGAGAKDVAWNAHPSLDPGYYSVQVNAVDRAGNRSAVRTINFVQT